MATKRQFEKITINNSPEIQKAICDDISTVMKRIWEFSLLQNGNNRSSAKTDLLHNSWSNIFINSFGDYGDLFNDNFQLTVEKEKIGKNTTSQIKGIIDIFGNTFKVDMLLTNEQKPHTIYLLKAPLTSINKNRYNSALNLFGEIQRFYGNPQNIDVELVFVNFTPKETFTRNENKDLKREVVQYLGLNRDDKGGCPLSKLPISDEIKKNIHEIHIEYEINLDFLEIRDEDTLNNLIKTTPNFISVKNESLDDLKIYIKKFIDRNNHILNIAENKVDDCQPHQLRFKF